MKKLDIENRESCRRRRHGPLPRPAEEVRKTRVSVYLTDKETEQLQEKAGAASENISSYLRSAGLTRLAVQVPAINQQAYQDLARVKSNLNQIAHALNILIHEAALPILADISDIQSELAEFRKKLLGLAHEG